MKISRYEMVSKFEEFAHANMNKLYIRSIIITEWLLVIYEQWDEEDNS